MATSERNRRTKNHSNLASWRFHGFPIHDTPAFYVCFVILVGAYILMPVHVLEVLTGSR